MDEARLVEMEKQIAFLGNTVEKLAALALRQRQDFTQTQEQLLRLHGQVRSIAEVLNKKV